MRVGDERHLHLQRERARGPDLPHQGPRHEQVGAAEVAFLLDHAVPALGPLVGEIEPGLEAPGTAAQPALGHDARVETIARAVAVGVGVQGHAGQGAAEEADVAEVAADGQAQDRVPRPGAELDVLMGQPVAAQIERVLLRAPEGDGHARAHRRRPGPEGAAADDERPRVSDTVEGLVPMMDVAFGQIDRLAHGVQEVDARGDLAVERGQVQPEPRLEAILRDPHHVGHPDVLDVPDEGRPVFGARVLVVHARAGGGDRRTELARRRRREEGPADRQVGVRSAGSAGFEGLGGREAEKQRNAEEERAGGPRPPRHFAASALSSFSMSAPAMSMRLPDGVNTTR